MVKVLIVEKNCNIKSTELKTVNVDELYKKCGFRKAKDFENRKTWEVENVYISVYAKDSGRAKSENKYEMPPPIDKDLYFGNILIIKHTEKKVTNTNLQDLTLEEWNNIYESLMGGVEDLNDEDSYSEEEEIPEHLKTKEGYSKEDGFIVDDDEDLDDDYVPNNSEEEVTDGDEDEDEDEEVMGKDSDLDNSDDEEDYDEEDDDEEDYDSDDIGSELSEESYISSDDE